MRPALVAVLLIPLAGCLTGSADDPAPGESGRAVYERFTAVYESENTRVTYRMEPGPVLDAWGRVQDGHRLAVVTEGLTDETRTEYPDEHRYGLGSCLTPSWQWMWPSQWDEPSVQFAPDWWSAYTGAPAWLTMPAGPLPAAEDIIDELGWPPNTVRNWTQLHEGYAAFPVGPVELRAATWDGRIDTAWYGPRPGDDDVPWGYRGAASFAIESEAGFPLSYGGLNLVDWDVSGEVVPRCDAYGGPTPAADDGWTGITQRGTETDPDVAVPLSTALLRIEADPTLVGYQAFRVLYPDAYLMDWRYIVGAWQAGLPTATWLLEFAAPGVVDTMTVDCTAYGLDAAGPLVPLLCLDQGDEIPFDTPAYDWDFTSLRIADYPEWHGLFEATYGQPPCDFMVSMSPFWSLFDGEPSVRGIAHCPGPEGGQLFWNLDTGVMSGLDPGLHFFVVASDA